MAYGIGKGWSKEECVEAHKFADRCPVDIGQADAMDYIQQANVRVLYDYLMSKVWGITMKLQDVNHVAIIGTGMIEPAWLFYLPVIVTKQLC